MCVCDVHFQVLLIKKKKKQHAHTKKEQKNPLQIQIVALLGEYKWFHGWEKADLADFPAENLQENI